MRSKRRTYLIDWSVQGSLIRRICGHWFAFLCATLIGLPLFRAIVLGDIATPMSVRLKSTAVDGAILLTLFVLLLPYFIYDTLRVSNKFAGPMFRLHTTIKKLSQGETVPPIAFRGDDFWQEVATDFNTMVDRVRAEERQGANQCEEKELVAT